MIEAHILVAVALCVFVGISMGLLGGGGSIVTVPILVYVAGIAPADAVTVSLAVVAATSLVGGVVQWRHGSVHGPAVGIYAVTGMAGAQAGAPLTRLVSPSVLMTLFAVLMVFVAWRMLASEDDEDGIAGGDCRFVRCALSGVGVGMLTGFLGVGGGFLIVPALVAFVCLPMRDAVGTSLMIIGLNSVSGFVAHARSGIPSPELMAACTAAALIGLAIGLIAARRTRPAMLKTGFGGLCFAVAAFLLVKNVPALLQ